MRRILSLILAVVLLLSCVPAALATDNSREFFFELFPHGAAGAWPGGKEAAT